MWTRILKIAGLSIGGFILFLGGVFFYIFGGNQWPRSGPSLGAEVEQVADGIATIYLMDSGGGRAVIVDAGADARGTPILEALKRRGKTAEDVAAIFITHAHP